MPAHIRPKVAKTGGPLKLTKVRPQPECDARVIIVVEKGQVRRIYSSSRKLVISVADWDVRDGDNGADDLDRLTVECKALNRVY